MKNCYRCADAQTDKCLDCKTSRNLDVSIQHGVKYSQNELPRDIEPATDCTRLEVDAIRLEPATATEKALKASVAALSGFTGDLLVVNFADLVLMVNLLRGGGYAGADESIRAAFADISKWLVKPMSRQTAWARVKRIKAEHPWLARAIPIMTRHLKSRKPRAVTRRS